MHIIATLLKLEKKSWLIKDQFLKPKPKTANES